MTHLPERKKLPINAVVFVKSDPVESPFTAGRTLTKNDASKILIMIWAEGEANDKVYAWMCSLLGWSIDRCKLWVKTNWQWLTERMDKLPEWIEENI